MEGEGNGAPNGAPPTALTIVLADDDRAILKLLEVVVRGMGHRPIPVTDGAAALRAIEAERVDMLISDIEMPHLSGIDLCRTVRDRAGESYLFTVLISAHDQRDVAALLDAGADDFITKPVIPAHLQARIRSGQRIIESDRRVRAVNRQLSDTIAEIRSALAHAEQIQRLMLPRRQEGAGFRAYHHWVPSQQLSGDIMAVVDLADDAALFYNLDVSGHGIRAALQATELFHILQARAREYLARHPDFLLPGFLETLNTLIHGRDGYTYIAGTFVVIRPRDRRLEIAQAGTDALHLIGARGDVTAHHRPGFPIGLFGSLDAGSTLVEYAPGTILAVSSDGLALSPDMLAAIPRWLEEAQSGDFGPDPIEARLAALAGPVAPADDLSLSLIVLA